jgi:hypothetical protein
MRIGLWLIGICLAVFCAYRFVHSGAPSAGEVEPVLRSYLESRCVGELDISQLEDIRVGEYSGQLCGWPVYANHVETCVVHDGSTPYESTMRTTDEGGHDADRNVAVAMVRRTASGRLEMYTPGFVQAAGREMQQMLDHALDNTKTN